MRAVFITHGSRLGGTEAALLEAVQALGRRGVDVRVVLPGYGPLNEKLRRDGVPMAVIPYTWWMGAGTSILRRLAKALLTVASVPFLALRLKSWRADVVVSWSITIAAGALAARLLRLPHVWALHEAGLEHHRLSFEWGDRLARRIVRSTADGVMAASQAAADAWTPLLDVRCRVIHQSVTPRAETDKDFHPATTTGSSIRHAPDRPPRFVVVGGAAPGKAAEEAVRALADARLRQVDVRLEIIGMVDGRDGDALRSAAASLGVAERVEFSGWTDDLESRFRGATALLAPSRHEGFGRAVVEAMLAGLPVLGARSGATPELVRDGENGLLYEPGDAAALAALMMRLIANPAETERLGDGARASARQRFTQERFGREMEALLREVAG